MCKKLLLLLFVIFPFIVYPQYENIIHKNVWDRIIALDSIRLKINRYNPEKFSHEINIIRSLGIEYNDEALVLESDLLWVTYDISHQELAHNEIIKRLEEIISRAKQNNAIDVEERSRIILADYYWKVVQNYELAFENYFKADQLLQQLNPDSFPHWTKHYSRIAMAFYNFRDYTTAIEYLKKGNIASINKYTWKNRWSATNNLGLCYLKIEAVDSAMYFFKQSIEIPFVPKDGLRYSISKGNMGFIFYKKNNPELALPLLINDLSNAEKFKDYGVAAGAAIPLADIYIEKDSFKKAEEYLIDARKFIRLSRQNQRLIEYYDIAQKLWFKQKEYVVAKQYQDSLLSAQLDVLNKYDALLLMRAQQKIDHQELETELEKNKLHKRINFIKTLIFLVILLSILIVGLLLYLYYQKKSKIINLRKEEEITNAKIQLKTLTKNIAEKNLLINKFQSIANCNSKAEIIDDLQKNNILTKDDWIEFKKKFENIYPDFFKKVIEIQDITPSEVRLFCLSKLNLSPTEISAILGVSPQSTRITWYRFKKKHNLTSDYSINDFLKKIN